MKKEEAVKILTENMEGFEDSVQYELEYGDDREWLHELEEQVEAHKMAIRSLGGDVE